MLAVPSEWQIQVLLFRIFFFPWRFLLHAWLNLWIQNLCIGRAMQRDPLQREMCSLCLWVFYWWHEKWSSVLKELQILLSWASQAALVLKTPPAKTWVWSSCEHLLDYRRIKRIKKSASASLTTLKPLTMGITTNWKILKEMGLPDHLTCLLRDLYVGQEATVRTRHGTTDWFKIGKGIHYSCILLPCLFNLYAESIMWNARLDEPQAGIKTAGRKWTTRDMQMITC